MGSDKARSSVRRVPLPEVEVVLLNEPQLSPETCKRLIRFNEAYQQRELAFFLKLRHDWQEKYPGRNFPGLCAEVDSITGEMRPLSEQRAWTWGDGRALGIWAALLIKGRIADEERTITLASGARLKVNMKSEFESYCDLLYESLVERYRACGERFPFMADIETNRSSDDPRNHIASGDAVSAADIFCLNAMYQYAMLRRNRDALAIGRELMDRCCNAARTGSYVPAGRPGCRAQGLPMVTVGAIVDILKTMSVARMTGVEVEGEPERVLVDRAREIVDYILEGYCNRETGEFWEEVGPDGRPYVNERGQVACDPGHTTECCGFIAELCSFLPDREGEVERHWGRRAILDAILKMNHFVTRHGFSERGVMFKNIDVRTQTGIPDTSGGGAGRETAPWWNVREHCASSLKLYELTGDEECLVGYKKAQNATYLHYANANIGGLMVQTLDPHTLEPLDIHPATGNLDPMHSVRAREREIEALERVMATH